MWYCKLSVAPQAHKIENARSTSLHKLTTGDHSLLGGDHDLRPFHAPGHSNDFPHLRRLFCELAAMIASGLGSASALMIGL